MNKPTNWAAALTLCLLSTNQHAAASPSGDADAAGCKMAAEHMINVGQQAASDPRSRPERTEKRAALVKDWRSRLQQGEDPCTVYADIQKAATTF